ncbi:MAG: uracil-DNA glycosylase [Bacteroidetes bacterium]|nr:uracil-DNA glycosylase [Bacteroidota bacterium]MDA1332992.1 uracil-DNA glycosylase [Bacteroidota bacterium]
MPTELDELRAVFEHQISLFGDVLYVGKEGDIEALGPESEPAAPPMDDPDEAQTARSLAHLQPTPEPSPESMPESSAATPDVYEQIATLIPENSPLHDLTSLEEVAAWVAATELIELDRTRIKPVFGVGRSDADLLVIGEAPGAEEDKQGEPFVGRAGKLLTQILQSIGFEREDVYIANILKSRPPNNRDPLAEEIAAHIPILHKQITLIKPKLILCVGRTSGTSLLGIQTSLKELRGTFHDYHGIPVLVTYHPAALLRNSNWKRPTWEDVQLLRARYDELTA